MKRDIAERLIELNRQFYDRFAAPFDHSRLSPQPGFEKSLTWLPESPMTVLDIGCGNGRYGHFLAKHGRVSRYTGLDISAELLHFAAQPFEPFGIEAEFYVGDMTHPDAWPPLLRSELVVCLSAMQHIPQFTRRVELMKMLSNQVVAEGRILIGNWQFLNSERQRRKIVPWETLDLADSMVEPNDYLLTWNRGGLGYRYVTWIDEGQINALAAEAGLVVIDSFLADGREGNLNLYTLLKRLD